MLYLLMENFLKKFYVLDLGAGSFPTASAVIADLIEIFRLLTMTSNSEDFQIGLKNPVFHMINRLSLISTCQLRSIISE